MGYDTCLSQLCVFQGIGSPNQSEHYDVQIFSLALLLSSYFIYNSLGSIDETALDRLSYAMLDFKFFHGSNLIILFFVFS